MKRLIICHTCGKDSEKETGEINRALRNGRNLFCDKNCAGLSRRVNRTTDEKKRLKAEYDAEYRTKNLESLKEKKRSFYQKTKDRDAEKHRAYRKKRMPKHVEYCRRPEYRKYKKEYDQKHRSQKFYGEFWEAAIILNQIENEIDRREAKEINELTNKTQRRKRLWQTNLRQKI